MENTSGSLDQDNKSNVINDLGVTTGEGTETASHETVMNRIYAKDIDIGSQLFHVVVKEKGEKSNENEAGGASDANDGSAVFGASINFGEGAVQDIVIMLTPIEKAMEVKTQDKDKKKDKDKNLDEEREEQPDKDSQEMDGRV